MLDMLQHYLKWYAKRMATTWAGTAQIPFAVMAIMCLHLIAPQHLEAAEERSATYLQANRFQEGAILLLKDNKIYGPNGYNSSWQSQFDIQHTDNLLSLMINPAANGYGKNDFSVTLDLKLLYKDSEDNIVSNSNGKDTTELSLEVGYNKQTHQAYKQQDVYHFTGGHYVLVKVANVSITGSDTSGLSDLVMLKSEMRVERYYPLASQKVNNLSHTYRSQAGQLQVSWQDMVGAEAYELEYTFVDNYDYTPGGGLQPPGQKGKTQVNYDFERNSQRIKVKASHYNIPAVYEQGYLVYRVRPLGRGGDFDKTAYGNWSLASSQKVALATPHVFTIGGNKIHEDDRKNWLYQSTFTENGKRSAAMRYFDGSNRERQVVSQLSTENNAIVRDILYDYEGREAINVLPAPVATAQPSPAIHYFHQFNQNQQGDKYTKADFDTISAAGCGLSSPPPMSDASGAGRYYSSQNQLPSQFIEQLPKSEGYPFSQTRFVPTEGNLPSSQGKPGPQHQVGSGHKVQYFYTTSPMQIELDRMFGAEAGKTEHYRKIITFDENGQAHVEYVNNQGNVVAEGLTGAPPSTLKQLPQDQVDQATLTGEILQSSNQRQGMSWVATHQFVVTTANTNYTFTYDLDPSKLQKDLCDGRSICYDGIYDVGITLKDDCGNIITDTTANVGDLSNLDSQCDNYGPLNITLQSGPLKKGNYILSKTLTLNEEAVQAYVDSFANEHCWQTMYDSIYDEQIDKADTANCVQGCGGVKASKVYRDTLPNGEVIEDTLTDQEQGELQARINSACGGGQVNMCQSAYEMMISDMSPGGQYAKYYDTTQVVNDSGDTVTKGFHPEAFPLSILNGSNDLPAGNASWKNPARLYRDTTGDTSWLPISSSLPPDHVHRNQIVERNGGFYVQPQDLIYTSDFVDHWQESWAKSLVKYHPEYCYYKYCSSHPQSNRFDSRLLMTGSYGAARDSGFIVSGLPNLLSQDPYFQQYPSLQSEMQDTIDAMVIAGSDSFSLREVVISMHHGCSVFACSQTGNNAAGVRQCVQQNSPLFAGKDSSLQNQLWQSYRSIYLALKRSIIERERHIYAINDCGIYNGCIGIENSRYRAQDALRMNQLNNQSWYQDKTRLYRQPCSMGDDYEGKQKRFPDGDDLYDYMDGVQRPGETADAETEAENMENFVENYMKRECDKCPQVSDLESFLNDLALNDHLTENSINANRSIASCDLVSSMSLPQTTNGYQWKASLSDRELTGTIYSSTNDLCTIKLYDTSNAPVAWDDILMFTCLEHVDNPNHYAPQQGGNFKIRAITQHHEAVWLEGTVSCMQLANCSVPNYCQTNELANGLVEIFNRTLGYYPLLRKLLIQSGKTAMANHYIPVHPGTDMIVDGVEITDVMTEELKNGHKEAPSPTKKYFWEVDTVGPDTNAISAGIFAKDGCRFIMYSDSAHKLNQPFVITDVIVNHPRLETEGCEQKEFLLEARYITITQAPSPPTRAANTGGQPRFELGEPFLIMVNSECYSVAECCPEKECPEVTLNGDFGNGNTQFQSDLAYSKTLQQGGFYGMKQSIDLDSSNLAANYQLAPGQLNNFSQPAFDPNNFQVPTFGNIPTTTEDTSSTGQEMLINQPLVNQMQLGNLNQVNNTTLLQSMNVSGNLPLGGSQQLGQGPIYGGNLLTDPNDYLVFYPAQKSTQTIWKQEIAVDGGTTYTLNCRIKLEKATGNLNQVDWTKLLNWKVGNTTGNWNLKNAGSQGNWATLTATFTAPATDAYDFSVRFAANDSYHEHIWAVDDISVQGVDCKNPMCCPPIMPKMPPETYENPCVSKKKEIAEENTETIVDQFMRDTLRGITEAFIASAMDVDETLKKSFSSYSYNMTLHYYDQVGNLVKTVPPKGYEPLSESQAQQVNANRQNSNAGSIQPSHTLATTYQYNTLNEVVKRTTPDGGTTRYWYDKLGRIVASQNAEQKRISDQTGGPHNIYNYNIYDEMGRVIESGQLSDASKMTNQIAKNNSYLQNWRQGGTKEQIKRMYYDEPLSATTEGYFGNDGQQFLRKKIATTTYDATDQDDGGNKHEQYDYAIHYSYDVHGHVKAVIRETTELRGTKHQLKRINYEYDILSGNITRIIYQPNQPDQFMHRYQYDADNRLTNVHTSRNGLVWQHDARYFYYPHGALARVELGEEKVQGIDYAYTLQGWLKGLNASSVDPNDDLGQDAMSNTSHAHVAADAAGYGMEYHNQDYKPVGSGNTSAFSAANTSGNTGKDLFDGSINHTISAKRGNNGEIAMAYEYDQLGRLVQMQALKQSGAGFQSTQDYQSTYAYDANGNLEEVTRNGEAAAGQQQMDDLTYHYQTGTNRVNYIADQADAGGYSTDLDNQSNNNYSYDAAGRMTGDQQAGVSSIEWNNDDKIASVQKGNTSITYGYGPNGRRIKKQVGDTAYYYSRGPQGRLLATYVKIGDSMEVERFNIYGRSRLGIYQPRAIFTKQATKQQQPTLPDFNFNNNNFQGIQQTNFTQVLQPVSPTDTFGVYHGHRQYELTNHLNNVLATVSDRKMRDSASGNFQPVVLTASDYYPYGMPMPGRASVSSYAYGFNGQEKDNDLLGNGNAYNFTARMYDARTGRWLSIDPKADSFPSKSPYLSMSGDPINRIDPDGMEDNDSKEEIYTNIAGKAMGWAGADYMFGVQVNPWINEEWKEKKTIEIFKKNLQQSKKVVSAMKDAAFHKGGFDSKTYKKLRKVEEGLDESLTKIENGAKVIDMVEKASSVMKIAEAWNKIDPKDLSQKGRKQRAKQFDIIFEETGSIMSDYTEYGRVVEEAGKQNFFSNMANYQHLGRSDKRSESIFRGEDPDKPFHEIE